MAREPRDESTPPALGGSRQHEFGRDRGAASRRGQPDTWGGTGWTLLQHAALEAENARAIKALIEAGAELDARTERTLHDVGGDTPLHIAVLEQAVPAAVEALLAAGADPDAREGNGYGPLHLLRLHEAAADVAEMLLAAGADVDARSASGVTALHSAVRTGTRAGRRDRSAGNLALVRVLLAAGADPNAQDCRGFTPLHEAVSERANPCVVKALLEAGADPNARNNEGKTPPELARRKDKGVIRLLRRAEAREAPPAPRQDQPARQ